MTDRGGSSSSSTVTLTLYERAVKNCYDFTQNWDTKCVPHLNNPKLMEVMNDCVQLISTVLGRHEEEDDRTNLPPIAVMIPHLDKFDEDVERVGNQLLKCGLSNIDSICPELSEAMCAHLTLEDEFLYDAELVLRKAGYRHWLQQNNLSHSAKHLQDFYQSHKQLIYWYIMPHWCIPWNNQFGFLLAQLSEPEQHWHVFYDLTAMNSNNNNNNSSGNISNQLSPRPTINAHDKNQSTCNETFGWHHTSVVNTQNVFFDLLAWIDL